MLTQSMLSIPYTMSVLYKEETWEIKGELLQMKHKGSVFILNWVKTNL